MPKVLLTDICIASSTAGKDTEAEDVKVQDVYLFESQEVDIEFSDGVCVTLSAQEVWALRDYVYRVNRVSESAPQQWCEFR
jgi:hypothetical protein